jgi:UDP-N-acetylmuramate dehydrogenase
MAIRIEHQVALAPRTTLAVGGEARHLVLARSEAEVIEALWWARRRSVSVTVLGGGSNSLIADAGVDGLVLQPAMVGRSVSEQGDQVLVEVGAGENWDQLVAWAVDQGLCGIEALSGIPGWVGAAPMQNIGAYGQEIASVVDAVRVVARSRGQARWVNAKELGFAYRMSAFKGAWRDRYIITSVRLRLRRGRPAPPRYAELAKRLGGEPDHPSSVRQAVLELRRSKSMVYDPEDANHRSAGSFFLNPLLSPLSFEVLRRRLGEQGIDPATLPNWPEGDQLKVPAAWLMERAGLHKGLLHGPTGLSSNHCLALINRGNAEAKDLIALAALARGVVFKTFGVTLSPEPVFVGFSHGVDELLASG